MKNNIIPVILTSTLIANSYGSLLIEESFDYDPLDGPGLSTYTQSGFGLSGNWNDSGTVVESPGMTYGSLATSGNKVTMSDDSSWVSTGSTLDGYLDDGDVLWFSVLASVNVGTNEDFGFAFGTDKLNDSNAIPMSNSGDGLGFRFKSGIVATAWSGGNASSASGASASDSVTYLVVGEIIFGATDTINIYLPDTAMNKGSIVSTQTATLNQIAFDTIAFSNKTTSVRDQVDEIRFGTSYIDVTPVPEPGTFALLGGLLSLTYVMLRRRRS